MSELDLRRKLAWLIGIRVTIVTLLLGLAILIPGQHTGCAAPNPFFSLIGLTYGLTVLYALSLRFAYRHRWLIDAQLACDALVVSAFIYVTGGVTSYFSLLHVLPIIAASMFQFRRGGLTLAVLSTLLYGGLVAAQYMGASGLLPENWAPSNGGLPSFQVAQYAVATNVLFFSVALLSGLLAESLRHARARLERASNEIADLRALNQHVIDSLVSGLGLAIVHRIVTDDGGEILVNSTPGAGPTVTVRLPLRAVAATA